MPVGFNLSINLSKIDKDKIFKSEKTGNQYLSLTGFISEEPDQFGNQVSVHERQSKEEREAEVTRNYLGNGAIFYSTSDDFEVPSKEEESPY